MSSSLQERLRRADHDFWKFWIGQSVSTLGSSLTGFALPLLIFQLTGSPLNLAFTVATSVVPYFLFGLPIGAWADRMNRKHLMIGSDLCRAGLVALIPLASSFDFLSVWWIYALAFAHSSLSLCFDAASFAAVPSLVKEDDLVKANGRLQAASSTAAILGPLLAGLLLVVVPLPLLLLFDAVSFLGSALSLAWVKKSFHVSSNEQREGRGLHHEILFGLRYLLTHPLLRSLTCFLLFLNFIAPTISVQLILFAKHALSVSDSQIGLLYASGGVGTVLFSLLADRLSRRVSFGVFTLGSIMLQGLLTAAMAWLHWYWVALLLFPLCQGFSILFNIGTYSLAQLIVPNQLLSRVMIFIRVLTWSTASVGALLGGLAIERTHVVLVYEAIGILIFLLATGFLLTPLGKAERYLSREEG